MAPVFNPPAILQPAFPIRPKVGALAPPRTELSPAPAPVSSTPSGFAFYYYRFHRGGSRRSSLDGGGQYGGSQSGFVATYTPDGNEGLALLLRGAIAHDRLAERELAAGLRLRPVPDLPVTITAERRFRHDRRDAFAVYLAGGKSGVMLPLDLEAEGYAQAGVISDRRSGAFVDFAARAGRKLPVPGNALIRGGAGVWGGGQKDVFRIDAGPTISGEIPLGATRLRIDADWRFRIAGDARPASGPALTLSTSF